MGMMRRSLPRSHCNNLFSLANELIVLASLILSLNYIMTRAELEVRTNQMLLRDRQEQKKVQRRWRVSFRTTLLAIYWNDSRVSACD